MYHRGPGSEIYKAHEYYDSLEGAKYIFYV